MLWKEKYELGVELIDTQHKELFQRVEDFLVVMRSNTDWQEKIPQINETLSFMSNYVVEHFQDEEQYQKKIEYPGYEGHHKAHSDMVSYVVEVSNKFAQNDQDQQMMQQFAGKLMAWLINHVVAEDLRIAKYAIEKGVAHHGIESV